MKKNTLLAGVFTAAVTGMFVSCSENDAPGNSPEVMKGEYVIAARPQLPEILLTCCLLPSRLMREQLPQKETDW